MELTQNQLIKQYLSKKGATITSLEALSMFGCFRLASRIQELRNEGLPIKVEKIKLRNGKFIAQYSL